MDTSCHTHPTVVTSLYSVFPPGVLMFDLHLEMSDQGCTAGYALPVIVHGAYLRWIPPRARCFSRSIKSFQCADFRNSFSLAKELREMCSRIIDSCLQFAAANYSGC